ncbi:hypothetical protein ACFYZN_34755 [Streptomyces sp. NPDC001777]|uniref:hypothetical protein n=1 Tax=Streptomyces sp. NPDC001777 TaxID=3364608 RepID=UPI0036AFCAA8
MPPARQLPFNQHAIRRDAACALPGIHPPFTRTKQVGAGLRPGLADGERRYGHYEKQLAARPSVEAPTITPDAEHDPFTAPDVDADRLRDRHPVRHRLDR